MKSRGGGGHVCVQRGGGIRYLPVCVSVNCGVFSAGRGVGLTVFSGMAVCPSALRVIWCVRQAVFVSGS